MGIRFIKGIRVETGRQYSRRETVVDKNQIDRGWRYFWKRRGWNVPPQVNGEIPGMFRLPGEKFYRGNMECK
jgi:hypothetical protein